MGFHLQRLASDFFFSCFLRLLVLIGIALMQYSIYANAHSLDRSDMCKHSNYVLVAPALNAVSEAGVEVSNTGEQYALHFREPCQSCNDEAWEYRPRLCIVCCVFSLRQRNDINRSVTLHICFCSASASAYRTRLNKHQKAE